MICFFELDAIPLFYMVIVLFLYWYNLLCFTILPWDSMECFPHKTKLILPWATTNPPFYGTLHIKLLLQGITDDTPPCQGS